MANTIFPLIALVSIFSLLIMCNGDGISSNNTGFSIEIFDRDSPLSPTYNSSLTPDQHLANAIQRSNERAREIRNHILGYFPYTYTLSVRGTYLASFQLGTPPMPILLAIDSGSNIIWTQCKGCTRCFPQTQRFFDPQQSSSYRRVGCDSLTCKYTRDTYCDHKQKQFCDYGTGYADGTSSVGNLGTDSIKFRSTSGRLESFPFMVFGCGYDNNGIFKGQESGILGMGSGYGSLIRQLDHVINGKFSYCLVSSRSSKRSSRLNFGDNAIVSGPGTVSTRLLYLDNHYFSVELDAISINHIRIEYPKTSNHSNASPPGNMIIDTGTTLTYLSTPVYYTLVNVLKNYLRLRTVPDPEKRLDLCFYATLGTIQLDITFHFRGANVAVRASDIFLRKSRYIVCFAVLPIDALSVFGNMAQVNFLVGFDLKANKVSFRRFNCENYQSV